jgi:hypothetical protein
MSAPLPLIDTPIDPSLTESKSTGVVVPTPTLLAVVIVMAVTVLFTPNPRGIALPVVKPFAVVPIIRLPVDNVNCVALTARPAVKSDTATFTVLPLCTIGSTSVPAKGVAEAVSAEIFLSAIGFNP